MLKNFVEAGIPEIKIGDYTATGRVEYGDVCFREDKPWLPSVYAAFEVRYVSYRNANINSAAKKLYRKVIEEYLDAIINTNKSNELLFISERISDKVYWKIQGDSETREIQNHLESMYEMFLHMTKHKREHGAIYTSVPKDIFVSFDDLLMIKSGVDPLFDNFDKERFKLDDNSTENAIRKLYVLTQKEQEEFYRCFAYGVSKDERETVINKTIERVKEKTVNDELDFDFDFDEPF